MEAAAYSFKVPEVYCIGRLSEEAGNSFLNSISMVVLLVDAVD